MHTTDSAIYGLLETTTKHNHVAYSDIQGSRFGFTYSSEKVLPYMQRLCQPFDVMTANYSQLANCPIVCQTIDDTDRSKRLTIASHLGELAFAAVIPETTIALSRGLMFQTAEFMNISDETNPQQVLLYGLSDRPEFSASTSLRRSLLRWYSLHWQHVTILHAASVRHSSGKTIVLASQGGGELGRNVGKTTLLLLLVTQASSDYAYVSNDDVVLGYQTQKVTQLPLPAEGGIRPNTLSLLQANDVHLPLEEGQWGDIRIYSPGSLQQLGFRLAPASLPIDIWIDIRLEPTQTQYRISPLTGLVAAEHFIASAGTKRLLQLHASLLQAEIVTAEDNALKQQYRSTTANDARFLYQKLEQQGCHFYQLRGGWEVQRLIDLVNSIL